MARSHWRLVVVGAAAALLGACATYPAAPSEYVYYAVPCDTPGAIRTIDATAAQSGSQQNGQGAVPADSAQAGATPVCLVAASAPTTYALGRYAPLGYYSGRPYYPGHVFSSLSFGGHRSIGHGFGHGGGGHGGGGHGGIGGHGGGGGGHGGGGRH